MFLFFGFGSSCFVFTMWATSCKSQGTNKTSLAQYARFIFENVAGNLYISNLKRLIWSTGNDFQRFSCHDSSLSFTGFAHSLANYRDPKV